MIKVLLVEDDTIVAKIILYYLEEEKLYEVKWAKTGGEALARARESFDVILMDVLLPDVNGIDLCEKLREYHDCPILFLSCLDDSDTIVNTQKKGGDDFLAKPFDNKVLSARIQANLRRYAANRKNSEKKEEPELACRGFSLDVNRHTVVRPEGEVKLSSTEFRILSFLMQHVGEYFTPKALYAKIWGESSLNDTRTVLVHIHNIRQKIETCPESPRYLKMVWGLGYTFDPEGAAPA